MKSTILTIFAIIASPVVLFLASMFFGVISTLLGTGVVNWYTFFISGFAGGAAVASMQLSLVAPRIRVYVCSVTLVLLVTFSVLDAFYLVTDNAGEPYSKLFQTFGFPLSFAIIFFNSWDKIRTNQQCAK